MRSVIAYSFGVVGTLLLLKALVINGTHFTVIEGLICCAIAMIGTAKN